MTARERAKRHPVVWVWRHKTSGKWQICPDMPITDWDSIRVRLVPLRDYREMTK